MKNKSKSLILVSILIFMASCDSDDPKKNAEKAGECQCRMYDIESQYVEDIQYDLLENYKKELVKTKNSDYDPNDTEKRYEKEYTWERKINDWNEYVRLMSKIDDLREEYVELKRNISEYEIQAYKASDNQDDYDDWIEEYKEEYEDYIKHHCKNAKEDLEKALEEYRKKEEDYFEEIPKENL